MGEHSVQSMVTSVVMLMAVLEDAGVDNVTIVTFGSKVTCVKTDSQPFDAVTIAGLLSALTFDEPMTRDADAIECVFLVVHNNVCGSHTGANNLCWPRYTIDLLMDACPRGPKTCFVFTDGYSSSGSALTRALVRADAADVQVVAVSVGLDKSQVKRVYQHWITAALPSALPQALQAFFVQDLDMPSAVRLLVT